MDTLDQDIIKLKNISFEDINSMHKNSIIQKYFDIPSKTLSGIEHIFKGQANPSGIVGYHTEIFFPNLYQQETIISNSTLDKTKPYELVLPDGKITSCFPITMKATDIIIAVLKLYQTALKNPPSNQKCSNWKRKCYLTEYGFEIQVVIKQKQKIYDSNPLINSY